jgi:hypothetical protein
MIFEFFLMTSVSAVSSLIFIAFFLVLRPEGAETIGTAGTFGTALS